MSTQPLCFLNGQIQAVQEATLQLNDLGLQRGYAIFDYARTYYGQLFHFQDHLARFRRSATALHLSLPFSNDAIIAATNRLLTENDLNHPAVRLLLTGGYNPTFEAPNFAILTEELPNYPTAIYTNGVSLLSVAYQRELPHIKTTNYMNSLRLEPLRKQKGAFGILYHSEHGVTECPRSNFFAFLGDTLVTAGEHILPGITRNVVIQIAAKHFRVEERKLELEELSQAQEAFITSTTRGILPIVTIDNSPVGLGVVGARTQQLMQDFALYTQA